MRSPCDRYQAPAPRALFREHIRRRRLRRAEQRQAFAKCVALARRAFERFDREHGRQLCLPLVLEAPNA